MHEQVYSVGQVQQRRGAERRRIQIAQQRRTSSQKHLHTVAHGTYVGETKTWRGQARADARTNLGEQRSSVRNMVARPAARWKKVSSEVAVACAAADQVRAVRRAGEGRGGPRRRAARRGSSRRGYRWQRRRRPPAARPDVERGARVRLHGRRRARKKTAPAGRPRCARQVRARAAAYGAMAHAARVGRAGSR